MSCFEKSFQATFAFEDLAVRQRICLLNELLQDADADEVRVAVNDPESLGVLAEARLIGLAHSDELARYLPASEVSRLGALVSEALVARLPEPT